MTVTKPLGMKEVVSTPTRRRAWAKPVVAILAVTLALGLVAVAGWMWTYQPMSSGNMSGVSGGPGANVREIDNYWGSDYRVVRAEPGSTVTVTMSLAVGADAPAGVTVNSVGSPVPLTGGDMVGFADSAETSSQLVDTPAEDRDGGNLADGPVRLEPGDMLQVNIRLTLPQCPRDRTQGGQGGWSSFGNQVPVDYSAFGISHTTNVPLGYALTFSDTPNCPA